ncbi:putative integral membrane protein [Janibacter sp. HTCC2649]|uniref:Bax inhibitor-1/YccA family protein n=1 Tax=Janibacter sp. HTCC2649 TaxID=313589 RepID=UPI0000670F41|nr:Bax inhibitor-1/YccA family protein [Janibacter sp. HTCC2649]EAP97234.1 putative integral membrane protein [Janibacter sp. HTCC2649]
MASNPAFNRLEKDAQSGYAGFQGDGARANPGNNVSYAQQGAAHSMNPQQLQDMYNAPTAGPTDTGRVTMDDVIMKTMGLFALVLGFGAVGWIVASQNQQLGFMLLMGGMIGTLVLGLVIAFKKTLSVPLIVGYAVLEGLFVGAVSQVFEKLYDGVVPMAAMATVGVFVGMFLAYKSGLIKVTDKFRRIVTMMIFGYAIFAVINFIFAMVTNTPFGIGGNGMFGIAISVFAVGLASVSLALDFDMIERAIATGAPQKYSWLLAHGLIVTVVWLYIEFLRLFARMRD